MELRPRSHSGHDWSQQLNLDALGIFYLTFAAVYSILLFAALFALFLLRHKHAIRIRSFAVICGSVLCLHVYLLLILLVYPLNGHFKCGWEFWIMSMLLPLGMALFQGEPHTDLPGNVRLYSYAREQRDIAAGHYRCGRKYTWNWRKPRTLHWLRHASLERRTYAGIMTGLAAQLIITIVLFFGSYRFHRSYGIFSKHVNAAACRRGTEWIPSVFWQFLWATVFGPFILLRIREIHDTHYWALQTRLAVIACLPGTPLWLTFTYVVNDATAEINKWFPPCGWFLPGLFVIQFVTIYFPLLDVYKLKKLEREFGRNRDGYETDKNDPEKPRNPYSMATLELQLAKNPSNLLYWAYTKEFTAENIMFLTAVRDFKRKWHLIARHAENLTTLQLRERYEDAALIYFKLVNPQTARMNINIDYKTFSELQDLFKGCQYEAFMDDSSSISKGSSSYTDNIVTPWADFEPEPATSPVSSPRPGSSSSRRSDEEKKLIKDAGVDKLYQIPVTEVEMSPTGDVEIPAKFCLEVFDRAYEAVKNDVYLNTWVRYEARYSRPRSPSNPRAASFIGVRV